jgi:peptidylprolyl isomerase
MPKEKKDVVQHAADIPETTVKPPRKKRVTKPAQAAGRPVDPERSADIGDTVTVEYIGTLPNGRVFDKSTSENPFVFTIGAQQVLPAFEYLVKGMKVGETKTFAISPYEAYGIWQEDRVITVERDTFPAEERIEVGKKAKVAYSGGTEQVMKVVEITDAGVKLDGNHPLAGYTLTFNNVTLTKIE